ncbi:MAG: SOS response-associated peptidase [Bacteroidetes bacterium]|nr:SOS response-associated peptidase [Bacteroidota bacterium]
MCGRIANGTKSGYLRERFDEAEAADILEDSSLLPRYNVTPGQFLPGIRLSQNGKQEWAAFRWGLIPSWAKPDKIPDLTFNARSETVADKPTFREAYKRRRCVIPISGYYEWMGQKGAKQPFYFHNTESIPLVLAGLWETWKHEDTVVDSCTILTTEADSKLGVYHHRMPVFLDHKNISSWLKQISNPLKSILTEIDTSTISIYPVSREVNSGRTDHAGLIDPLPQLL